jgi:hypothetical protein
MLCRTVDADSLFVLVDELNNAVIQAARAVLGDGICVFIREWIGRGR